MAADTPLPLPQGRQPSAQELWRSLAPWLAFASGGGWSQGFQVNGTGVSLDDDWLYRLKNSGLYGKAFEALASDDSLRLRLEDAGVHIGGPVDMNSTLDVAGVATMGRVVITGLASPGVALDVEMGDVEVQAGDVLVDAGSVRVLAGYVVVGNNYEYRALTTGGGLANIGKVSSSNEIVYGTVNLDVKVFGHETKFHDLNGTAQLTVQGSGNLGVRVERLGIGTNTDVVYELYVSGQTRFSNQVLIDSDGLDVTAGGISITAGGLGVSAGGAVIVGTTTLLGDVFMGISGANKVGFYGAPGQTLQTLTGVYTGTLGQLQGVVKTMAQILASVGLLVDSTT